MQLRQISTLSAVSVGFAATVPAFLILSLNGTTLFYGMDTVASLSAVVGITAFVASLFSQSR